MTRLTTEWWVNGRVTHQTIGHLRMVRRSSGIALCQGAMTGHAGGGSFQVVPHRHRWRQVGPAIDGGDQGWSNISQLQVLLVIEFQSSRGTLENICTLAFILLQGMQSVMAGYATCCLRQVVISSKP